MSTAPTAAVEKPVADPVRLAELNAELSRIVQGLVGSRAHEKKLLEEREMVIRALVLECGQGKAETARRAGVSAMIVTWACDGKPGEKAARTARGTKVRK